MDRICGFSGQYRFLSNFYPVNFVMDGVEYNSSEQAYMCSKTTDPVWIAKIMATKTGGQAKRIGRLVPLRAEWEEKYKMKSMLNSVLHKFLVPDLWEQLDSTGNAYLEETNTWGDVYWGVCDGVGKNWLGRVLMHTRKIYRIANESV